MLRMTGYYHSISSSFISMLIKLLIRDYFSTEQERESEMGAEKPITVIT